ncbi:MAG: phosphoenolpyruvate--protein phosphotransferase [Spirochaetaceae bacterium]|jgi:phosphotransferase system enzyme I (PtsI)|nr:phosphoenolpyruvate--protein phosphotransferase [Spirochaetaceae bacterium]
MTTLRGIPASAGFAIGQAFMYYDIEFPPIPHYTVGPSDAPAQWRRMEEAVSASAAKVQSQIDHLSPDKDKVQFDMLTVHLLMLHDPDFLDQVKERLFGHGENIEWAVWSVAQTMVQRLMESGDAYLRERAVDIADMADTLVRRLLSIEEVSLADLSEEVIVVTNDLMPSQALAMNRDFVKGIVMAAGSYTSHTAILCRAFGIPAVVGLPEALKTIEKGEVLSIDGGSGEVVVNPGVEKKKAVRLAMKVYAREREALSALRDVKAVTQDGKEILLKANMQIAQEIGAVFDYGADGVGLFRSEFLFLTPGEPMAEDRQAAIYTDVIKAAHGKSVVIRTSDVGGDKVLPNLFPREEKNPLLGCRAVRFSFAMPELFKAQLRAILRASAHGDIRVMFPMISGVDEMNKALGYLEECKAELRSKGIAFNDHMKAGSMIEIPSAALTADILAKKCDFFSIGTNDLMQYTLAIDRGNERVSYLADPRHPAFLRLIKMTVTAGHEANIPVSICGETGGDPALVPLLVGLGVDELSMAAAQIPLVKKAIREVRFCDCEALAEELLCR